MSCASVTRLYRRFLTGFCVIATAASSTGVASAQAPTAVGKHFDRVVLIVLENEGTRQALSDSYLAELSKEGAWFSNYYAIAHPSFPNYLALVSGSTLGRDDDHRPPPLKGLTIVDRLEASNLTWKSYAENYPGGCYLGSAAGSGKLTPTATPTELYVRKHVPLLAFASIQNNRKRCARVVSADDFMRDVRSGSLPNYAFYTPNMFDDGHDTSLGVASKWLSGFLTKVRAARGMERTLIAVTWDEGAGSDFKSNRVLLLLLGDMVNPGQYRQELSHYSLLRTIEENFGLEPLTDDDRDSKAVPESVWRTTQK